MTSFYDLTIPVLTKVLQSEVTILKNAEDYAKDNSKSVGDLLAARLAPDMYPLSLQVNIIVILTQQALKLLLGQDFNLEFKEYTQEECHTILADNISKLANINPESINGKESETLEWTIGKEKTSATDLSDVQRYLIPSVYFHLMTSYSILRKEGVPLGKKTYLTHLIDGWTFTSA
ncbi:hypothetical protein F4804DRAFT_326242 [Jackrogersella minutella]|nr:hypothetical protein F4804DRAFT_326242 [Jackrogersella minutella]